jgi:hypothetical protein
MSMIDHITFLVDALPCPLGLGAPSLRVHLGVNALAHLSEKRSRCLRHRTFG